MPVIALGIAFLLGLLSTEIADPDFWWHLKTGEYIATRHALPVPDPFAYTTDTGRPAYPGELTTRKFNLTHEWLSQLVWYGAWRGGGFGAVVLLKAILLTTFCCLAGVVAWRRSGSFYWSVGAAAAAATLARLFTSDRPALLTFVFTALLIAILEFRRGLWAVPLLSLLWANMHGGFFMGWVVLGIYCAEALYLAWRGRPPADARRLCTVSAIAVLLSGLNPNFFAVVETLSNYRKSFLTSTLVEWSKPFLWGPPYAYDILLYATAAVLVLSWRHVRLADWLLFAAFGAASLMAFRNIIFVAFLAPVLLATYLPELFPRLRRVPKWTGAVVALALMAGLGWGIARGSFYQFRAAEWRYPKGAADFLLAHNIRQPIYNTYEYGGYLIWRLWPVQRVFIDGRALNESLNQEYRTVLANRGGAEQREAILRRFGAGVVVMNAFEYTSGVVYPLALALGDPAQTEWKLVYEDAQAMVFMREPPPDIPVLDRSRVLPHFEAECRLHVDRDPEFSLCARTLADRFLRSGDRTRARQWLAYYLAHPYASDPDAERAYREMTNHP